MNTRTEVSVPRRHRFVVLAALLVVLALVAAACGGDDDNSSSSSATTQAGDTGGTVTRGGTLRFGIEADVATLDPAGAIAGFAPRDLALAVYDPLLTYDKTNKLVPYLASSWKTSDDLKTYTLGLRQGVTFQDGTPFNADAVVAHFKRQMDPATNCICAGEVKIIDSVTKTDDSTVVIQLKSPSVGFGELLTLNNGYVESPAAVAKYGKDYGQHPVGTGPFKLTEFASGDHFTVEANPTYWKKDASGGKLPYLDKIIFRPIPDTKQRLASLKAGDVDMIQTADTSTLKDAESAGFVVEKDSGASSTIVMFNNKRPPVDDAKVRQALAYAINKQAINQVVWGGTKQLADSFFATDSPFYVKNSGVPTYSEAKAKALLKSYGKPVSITIECIPTPEADQAMALVKQMWEAVGVQVTLRSADQGQYVNRVITTHDYQVACFRSAAFVDPDSYLTSTLTTGSGGNLTNYSNPAVEQALADGRSTADLAPRKVAYAKVQKALATDVPVIETAYDLFANIHKRAVRGVPQAEAASLGSIKPTTIWLAK